MQESIRQWPIALDCPPQVLQVGIGTHGKVPLERYQMDLWCLHLYHYVGELSINDETFPIRPGYASITPPHAVLMFRYYGRSVHAYAHFSCATTTGEQDTTIPAMQDLADDFLPLYATLEQAVGVWARRPARAVAHVWDVLWRLTERQSKVSVPTPRMHPAVEQVLRLIELRLSEPLSVAALADEVGLSHNHLTRLFHAATGMTVVGYIQQRRVERARHLLLSSTRSIKSIAEEVGIADLHLFNKTIRHALGAAPRHIREHK